MPDRRYYKQTRTPRIMKRNTRRRIHASKRYQIRLTEEERTLCRTRLIRAKAENPDAFAPAWPIKARVAVILHRLPQVETRVNSTGNLIVYIEREGVPNTWMLTHDWQINRPGKARKHLNVNEVVWATD